MRRLDRTRTTRRASLAPVGGAPNDGRPGVRGTCLIAWVDRIAQKCEDDFMRTTIELPDDLFRRVKAQAALDGLKLKVLITHYVEQGLLHGSTRPDNAPARRKRSEPPVVRLTPGEPLLRSTNTDLFQILDEEEIADDRYGGSAGH